MRAPLIGSLVGALVFVVGSGPAAAQGYKWTGFYAGLNAGAAIEASDSWNNQAVITSTSTAPANASGMASAATSEFSNRDTAFAAGGQIGYNFRLSPAWLLGVETDIQKTWLQSNDGSTNTVAVSLIPGAAWRTTIDASRQLTYLGTLRGRVGVTLQPDVLLFATGGLAYGGTKANTTLEQIGVTIVPPPPSFSQGSISDTRVGYAVGGGLEWMFWSNLSAKFEYLYYDLGSVNYSTGGLAADLQPTTFPGHGIASVATNSSTKFNGSDIRVGVNYHLN